MTRRLGWVVTVVVPIVAAILVIANSSRGQVQEGGTGKSRQSTTSSFNPPPNQ